MKSAITFLLCLLCAVASAQDPTDIYLFDVEQVGDGLQLKNMRNITNHEGYDNQPFFHPSEPLIFYSSFNDEGRSDIKSFHFKTGETRQVTDTNEREYSPTVTPDGKFLSCIIQRDDGAQDLGKYPIDGGEPVTLIDDLIVGYHVWIDGDRLLLFVLGDEVMTLHHYNLKNASDEVVTKNIGRALHKIPGQKAMSFVDKSHETDWWITRFDINDLTTKKMLKTLTEREDLAWTADGHLLMSDGKTVLMNSKLEDGAWTPLDMGDAEVTGITRIAISADGKHLALVADE